MTVSGQWSINFVQGGKGATFPEGKTLSVSFPTSKIIFGGIYQNGFPVIIWGQWGDTSKIVVKRSAFSIKGKAVLKARAYLQDWTNQYVETAFTIT